MKEVLINALLKINPNSARRYFPDDKSFYIAALKNNSRYEIPEEEINKLFSDINTVKEIIRIRPEYLKYYTGSELEIYIEALKSNPSFELDRDIIEQKFSFRPDAMGELIKIRPNLIKYYQFADENTYIEAIKKGYNITKEDLESAFTFNPLGLIEVLKILPNNEIIEEFIKKNFKDRPEIIIELLKINPKYIYYYSATDDIKQNENIFKEAINNGYNPKPEDLKIYPQISQIDCVMELLIKQDPYLILQYMGEDTQKMAKLTNFSPKIPWEIVRYFKGDKKELIDNYELISSFLEKINIKEEKFIQYAFGSNNNWLEDIKMISSGNIEEFIKVKDFFDKNFYDNKNKRNQIINFIDIMKNYNKYKEICMDIISKNEPLTEEEKRNIKYLFAKDELLEKDKPKRKEDIANVNEKLVMMYKNMLKEDNTTYGKINVISKMLFNKSIIEVQKFLSTYGNTMELKKIAFNDKNNPQIKKIVDSLTIFTSMMEAIIDIYDRNDEETINELLNNILNKPSFACECSTYFTDIEEKMRFLYEKDAQTALTPSKNATNLKGVKGEDGIERVDFSDKQYLLLAHTKSLNETPEELVEGKSSASKNFICLSAISYRNQVYFHEERIIFGYEAVPNDSFIMSSQFDFGSNGLIGAASTEVAQADMHFQIGIVETSSVQQINEFLMFREGLVPSYIILPGGREPTEAELEIVKKYPHIKFAITQEIGKEIDNPQPIEYEEEKTTTKTQEEKQKEVEELKELKEKLQQMISNKKERKIAVLADPHGFFEPTLAALEDARRQGVTEIYSLGDNIGTGPNPKEVMDLLEEYNVKSVIGNHEIYAIEGIEPLLEHLSKLGNKTVREAERNGAWTEGKLTEEQKERIKVYPKVIELKVGGKKIALCHSIADLNNGKLIINTEDFDQVLQGHIHFKGESGNVKTLSGVGIGSAGKGDATYIIITEKPDGGYTIEERYVGYDIENVHQDINTSDLDQIDKNKAESFAKTSRGR